MSEPQITVIKPAGGFKLPKFNFRLPKSKPAVLIVATVVLAIISVVTALYLYQRRTEPVAPTAPASKPKAASTTTISDNFDGASLDTSKWSINGTEGQTPNAVTQSGGKVKFSTGTVTSTYKSAGILTNSFITGDYSAEVTVSDLTKSGGPSDATSVAWTSLVLANDSVNSYNTLGWWIRGNGEKYVKIYNTTSGTSTGFSNETAVPTSTSSIKLKLTRIGSAVQGFVDMGSGYQLVGTVTNAYAGDGNIQMDTFADPVVGLSASASYDNFTAQVNLSGAVAPTPGTPAACTTSFTVLALSPTPTPGPTPTPTGGPSPTPTPTPTPTPSPTPGAPNDCNGTCGSNANCSSGLFCFDTGAQKYCRNPLNPTSVTCAGTTPAPTPTPTPVALGPTPTPITLEEAGSVAGTWTVSLAGGALLLLGAVLMLAL